MTHEHLLDSIAVSPIATVITNPRRADYPLEVANPAFSALTGYREDDIIGRNYRFLAGEATEPWITERIREAIRLRHSVLVDILNYRRNGSPFRNGVLVTPLFDDHGKLAWFLGSQVELGPDHEPQFAARRARAVALVKTALSEQMHHPVRRRG